MLWLAVPDSNRTHGLRFEHDLADCVADQLRDAAPRPRGGLAQSVKLFLAEVYLSLFHVCHPNAAIDIRQGWRLPGPIRLAPDRRVGSAGERKHGAG